MTFPEAKMVSDLVLFWGFNFFAILSAILFPGSKNVIFGKICLKNGKRKGRCVLDKVTTSI